MTDIPYPAAPKGLVLDDCTVSGDGGRTRPTLADFVADTSGFGGSVASAVQAAAEAIQKAQEAFNGALDAAKAAEAAQSAASGAVAKTDVALPDFDQVAGMRKGVLAAASASYSGALLGQGAQVSWNDPPGSAGTSFTNISPPGTIGGHKFFNVYSGTTALDSNRWGFRLYTDWGFSNLGLPGSTACQWIGRPDSGNWQFLNFFCAAKSYIINENDATNVNSADASIIARGGTGNGYDAEISIRAAYLDSEQDGVTNLGGAGNRFNNLFLAGTVNQVSDANEKDVLQALLEPEYADRAKLLAFYDALSPVLYRYKTAVSDKAGDARTHVGVIAQAVEAALKDSGLDPADWSLWSQEPLMKKDQIAVETNEEKKIVDPKTGLETTLKIPKIDYRYETKPLLDENGQPRVRQSLNYIELLMLMSTCQMMKQRDFETRLAALEAAQHGS
ncbi:hypothetical protein CGLAMM_01045 [Acetobacteraceae bacterium EV16G]|uniref:Peptidase S74 domain-containing protein n=1 Tax=Sorlinia euscelidii TaxID=3081148 RepID=A0ABU7U5M0_9PROT